MKLFQLFVVSVVCGGFVVFLGREIVKGLRSGRMRHKNTSSYVERKKNLFLLGTGGDFYGLCFCGSSYVVTCSICFLSGIFGSMDFIRGKFYANNKFY